MAVEGTFFQDVSLSASASLASAQWYSIRSTGNFTAALCIGSSGGVNGPIGILQNAPAANQAATVRVLGYSKAIASSSAISAGALLTATTDGGVITAVSTGARIFARAATASAAVGDIITVYVQPPCFYTAGASA